MSHSDGAGGVERGELRFWMHIQYSYVLCENGRASVGIHDVNGGGSAFRPAKASAPLRIHAEAGLSCPCSFKHFEPVPRRHAQVLKTCRRVDHDELAVHDTLELLR